MDLGALLEGKLGESEGEEEEHEESDSSAFDKFYDALKSRGFVIYPGKVSHAQCFRIGSIGDVQPEDMTGLVGRISEVIDELGVRF